MFREHVFNFVNCNKILQRYWGEVSEEHSFTPKSEWGQEHLVCKDRVKVLQKLLLSAVIVVDEYFWEKATS